MNSCAARSPGPQITCVTDGAREHARAHSPASASTHQRRRWSVSCSRRSGRHRIDFSEQLWLRMRHFPAIVANHLSPFALAGIRLLFAPCHTHSANVSTAKSRVRSHWSSWTRAAEPSRAASCHVLCTVTLAQKYIRYTTIKPCVPWDATHAVQLAELLPAKPPPVDVRCGLRTRHHTTTRHKPPPPWLCRLTGHPGSSPVRARNGLCALSTKHQPCFRLVACKLL